MKEIKNNKFVLICSILVVLIVILTFVNIKDINIKKLMNKKNENQLYVKNITEKFNIIEKKLIGRKVKSIQKILSDSLKNTVEPYIVFLFTGNDCPPCIDKGFQLTKKLDNKYKKRKVYIIASNADISRYLFNNDYYRYIFTDNKDLIRRELNFIFTPAFLSLDSSLTIKDLYFPLNSENDSLADDFIYKIAGDLDKEY